MHDALLARVLTIDKDIKIQKTRAVKNRNNQYTSSLKAQNKLKLGLNSKRYKN
jgi:hypothetical protein